MSTKLCSGCGQTKPTTEFPKRKQSTVGFRDAAKYGPCKECNAARAREWRKKHKNYQGSGRLAQYPKEHWPLMSAIRARLREANTRIKKFNKIPTNLNEEFLYELWKKQNGKCALLGHEMTIERKHPLCISLDQIECSKGYVRGNVQWVTWVANRAKGDMSTSDFYQMCEIAINYQKVQRLSKGTDIQ